MKIRIPSFVTLILAATLTALIAGVAIGQVPAVQAVLAPLTGEDREIIVSTFKYNSEHEKMLGNLLGAVNPDAPLYFKGRADAYAEAAFFIENYQTPKVDLGANSNTDADGK